MFTSLWRRYWVEQAYYRVAQEALNNVARHAQARQVNVSLVYEAERLELCIHDDGIGFDPNLPLADISMGLHSMQERIAELNGQFTLQTEKGRGTTIMAAVPISPSGALYNEMKSEEGYNHHL